MKNSTAHRRVITALVMAGLATPLFASWAAADHGHSRRYRRHDCEVRVVRAVYRPAPACGPRHVSAVVYTSPEPVFAGFVGGVVLGAALASATPAAHAYWDSECGRSFASIEFYGRHGRAYVHGHPVTAVAIPAGYRWYDLHGCGHCGASYWGGDHDCD